MVQKKSTVTGQQRPKRKTREQQLAERRAERQDLGSQSDKMRTPKVDGLVFRWENDELKNGLNRIQRLIRLGWAVYEEEFDVSGLEVVERDKGSGAGHRLAVGENKDGSTLEAVLMYISKEVYELDQQLKEEAILEKEDDLRSAVYEENTFGQIGGAVKASR